MKDSFFKRIFSHPRMIEFLIRSEIPDWADAIDFSSLRGQPAAFVDDKLRERYADSVWVGRSLDGGTEFLLLLEFQGHPERGMARRTVGYRTLALQELCARDKALERGDRDINAHCLVLYHGDRPWNVPTDARRGFPHPVRDAYRLVAPRPPEAPPPTPLDLPRMCLGLVRISTARRMRAALRELRRVVRDHGDDDFDRFLTRPVKAMLRLRRMSSDPLEEAKTMQTVATAFQESLDEIRREGIELGIEKGIEKGIRRGREQGIRRGREQGREEGRVTLLRELVARKFGPAAAEELERALGDSRDPKLVARAADACLDCDTADDFAGRLRGG